MKFLAEVHIKEHFFALPDGYQGTRFIAEISGSDSPKMIGAVYALMPDETIGLVEIHREPLVGNKPILFDVPSIGSFIKFQLAVFDWVTLPLTFRLWQVEHSPTVEPAASSAIPIKFTAVGNSVLSSGNLAVYVGDGKDFWTVGCRSNQAIKNRIFRFSAGAGRSVLGVSSHDFDEPRWWHLDYGWYVHSFEEIRAVNVGKIPENGYFEWSPLDELGMILEGNRIAYQVRRNGDSSFQTLYSSELTVSSSLRPVGVLGPRAFIYNAYLGEA